MNISTNDVERGEKLLPYHGTHTKYTVTNIPQRNESASDTHVVTLGENVGTLEISAFESEQRRCGNQYSEKAFSRDKTIRCTE